MTDPGPRAWSPAPIGTERLVLREPQARDRAALIEPLASPRCTPTSAVPARVTSRSARCPEHPSGGPGAAVAAPAPCRRVGDGEAEVVSHAASRVAAASSSAAGSGRWHPYASVLSDTYTARIEREAVCESTLRLQEPRNELYLVCPRLRTSGSGGRAGRAAEGPRLSTLERRPANGAGAAAFPVRPCAGARHHAVSGNSSPRAWKTAVFRAKARLHSVTTRCFSRSSAWRASRRVRYSRLKAAGLGMPSKT
jgi:hypothetical protein